MERSVTRRIYSQHNLGVASTDGQVFVTWQDSRNGNPLTGAEDVYFSSINLDGTLSAKSDHSGAPGGVVFGAGLFLGLGVVTALAAAFARRTGKAAG